MLLKELTAPNHIAVIGASESEGKPGGKVLRNLIDGKFKGEIYAVNKRKVQIDNVHYCAEIKELPKVDLAILAIPAAQCIVATKQLLDNGTRAFIVFSAGFSEADEMGNTIEREMVKMISAQGGMLIGPNCIGILNQNFNGVFTRPIPKLHPQGIDLISSSGATAVFLMEAGMPLGLRFNSVFSVGNAAQIGIEDVLEHLDESFDASNSSKIKLLYIEDIKNPKKFFKHAVSLINKGCRIAAIKSGTSIAGGRAASSHTGALATSEEVVRALFRKAGIVYCSGRAELITVGSLFTYKELTGKNLAIITHAGGSAVMLTDTLSKGGLDVPEIKNPATVDLLDYLYPGSSVKNPIDFLATGTADQLGIIIDYCEHKFDEIDAIIVVFGSPGLLDVKSVYKVLNVKMDICKKPIFPVLPSIVNAQDEIEYFLSKGRVNFPDEVELGKALCVIYNTPNPVDVAAITLPRLDKEAIRNIIENAQEGYLQPNEVNQILAASGIPIIHEALAQTEVEAIRLTKEIGFPVAMKVVGPVHKTDVGGVVLNVANEEQLCNNFRKLIHIEAATGVLIQQMASGIELFVGAKKTENYGHMIMCGWGGVYIELIQDIAAAFAPVSYDEAAHMIASLKMYPLFGGVRGSEPLNKELFIDIIQRLSALVKLAPEIEEIDLNPLLAKADKIVAVDARIAITKEVESVAH